MNNEQKTNAVPNAIVMFVPNMRTDAATRGENKRAIEMDSPPIRAYSRCVAPGNLDESR